MLVHGHGRRGNDRGVLVKGAKHVPEPAYPSSERGYLRFCKEVAAEVANGRVFTEEFKTKYLKNGWRKIHREEYSKKLEEVYTKAGQPSWIQWASARGVDAGSKIVLVAGVLKTKAVEVYSRMSSPEAEEKIESGWVEVQ